ncbi:MAG: M6 family metalloprotease domain-containing protein, partial [Candidatus Eisenbacteria bacterium]|nr:M6 family metalloprotease domain-containing protein [Candidatus Eisenbacteria bacterium]
MIRPTGPAIQPRGPCDLVPVLVLLVLGSVLASRSAATSPPFSAPAHRLPGGVPAERSFRLPSSASTAVPFEYRLLVVLVEFRDVRASRGDDRVTPELVYERLFGDGAGTLSSYWREASNGRLLIRGTVTPWVRVDSTYASYASAGAGNLGSGIDPDAYPHNAPRLVEEAIGRLGGGYRFQDFDNNRDGTVDGLLVIHAGPGLEEATRTPPPDPRLIFLAHQSHTRRELTVPGSVVFDYAFVSVGAGHGVAAHEFGHLLGLKDLYDTGFFAGRNGPFGVGDWSLMGTGALVGGGDMPTGLDADSRIRLGFIEPTVIVVGEPPGDIDVVRGDHPVYKFGAGSDPREYFLLEPRWRQGIDAGLPGEGFLIWHIDERQTANRGPDLYRVALVQPDGRNDLGRTNGNRGDAGDVWPTPTGSARDRFDDTTTPSARTNAGLPSTVSIRGMSRSADRLRAIYQISPDVAIELGDLEVTEINGDGDGRVEPTETANIDVTLCNRGESASGPLTLTLMIDPTSSDNFQVGVPVVMEAISAGGCGRTAQPLSLTILPGGFEPTAAGTILVVTDPEGGVMASIDLLLPLQPGPPITLTAAPGEPAWRAVALNPEQGAPWSVTTARFRTPPAAWRLGPTVGTRYAPNLDAAWLSPVFVVPARHPQLTVWSVMDAETLATGRAFDGGRFEIQSGLSDWQALSPAGGWPFELESASGNALAG